MHSSLLLIVVVVLFLRAYIDVCASSISYSSGGVHLPSAMHEDACMRTKESTEVNVSHMYLYMGICLYVIYIHMLVSVLHGHWTRNTHDSLHSCRHLSVGLAFICHFGRTYVRCRYITDNMEKLSL